VGDIDRMTARDTETLAAELHAIRVDERAAHILATSRETSRILADALAESRAILADLERVDRSGPYTRPETRTR